MREHEHRGHELALGEIKVRVRRNPGAGVPAYLWDVMDGLRVAETFASVPSQADAEDAIRRFRAGDTQAKRLAASVDRAVQDAKARAEVQADHARRGGDVIKRRGGRPRKHRSTEDE